MKKHMREFHHMIKTEGFKLVDMTPTNGGHYKATIEGPDGRRMVYTLSSSSSDHRAKLNRKRDIVRFFNN